MLDGRYYYYWLPYRIEVTEQSRYLFSFHFSNSNSNSNSNPNPNPNQASPNSNNATTHSQDEARLLPQVRCHLRRHQELWLLRRVMPQLGSSTRSLVPSPIDSHHVTSGTTRVFSAIRYTTSPT
ncbi:uncharacterized protein L3040_006318 [Drepanopeziza brunnea f. sp. 'multigermtubi']|uniref:uncharacterized protein n=1 Tax=Drepanopeziza brunnea f. sp. 'multigermtubi' TaxID=698441 RepID=UPI00238F2D30|nr:hypothetical protein L3040_006318 [Drepanopeziza brunnea f. sp. 'multigermtubi']